MSYSPININCNLPVLIFLFILHFRCWWSVSTDEIEEVCMKMRYTKVKVYYNSDLHYDDDHLQS